MKMDKTTYSGTSLEEALKKDSFSPLHDNGSNVRLIRFFACYIAIFLAMMCNNASAGIIKFDFIEFSSDVKLASFEFSALPASINEVTSLNFTKLGALRMGVGIGEFPFSKASGSLIAGDPDPMLRSMLANASDHFPGTGTSEGGIVWITINAQHSPFNSLLETMTTEGNFQASGAWFQVPEPNTFALGFSSLIVIIVLRCRRRR